MFLGQLISVRQKLRAEQGHIWLTTSENVSNFLSKRTKNKARYGPRMANYPIHWFVCQNLSILKRSILDTVVFSSWVRDHWQSLVMPAKVLFLGDGPLGRWWWGSFGRLCKVQPHYRVHEYLYWCGLVFKWDSRKTEKVTCWPLIAKFQHDFTNFHPCH